MQPRLFTPPLRPLNRRTSEGYAVIDFAEKVLGLTLMPWQKWLLVHAMELLPNGSLRFRYVLVLVARQNGKSTLAVVLALYWLYQRDRRLVLGTSATLEYAKEAWQRALDLAEEVGLPVAAKWEGNNKVEFQTDTKARYKIAAANRKAGRSLTVHNLLVDELREHRDWDAWAASSNATNAVPDAQVWALSNAGDDTSVVLNHFHDAALAGTSDGWFIAEWSAPDGCELTDRKGWAYANPSLGYTLTEAVIEAALAQPPAQFRTEVLCQRVVALDSPLDLDGWAAGADPSRSLEGVARKVHAWLDVAPDGGHVTLAAALLLPDRRPRVEVIDAWSSVQSAREALPALLTEIRPRSLGWFPGPADVLAADLAKVPRAKVAKAGDANAACASLAEQIASRRLVHSDDPLLNAHVAAAKRLRVGQGWRFGCAPGGHVDAAYAAAGAVYAARAAGQARPMRLITAASA